MSDDEIEVTCGQVSFRATGAPDVQLDDDGDLQIYPVGYRPGAQVMFMNVEAWRALNDAVEAAIARRPAGGPTKGSAGGIIPFKPRRP